VIDRRRRQIMEEQNTDQHEEQDPGPARFNPAGLPIGIGAGVALGAALGNIGIGLAIGAGIGIALSLALGAGGSSGKRDS
jgi:hypothetical protein